MSSWACGIDGCEQTFEAPEPAIVHQTADHEPSQCQICGMELPAGYFAIHHAFEDHTRAEYVRAYGASAAEVRLRESAKDRIEAEADLADVIASLEGDTF